MIYTVFHSAIEWQHWMCPNSEMEESVSESRGEKVKTKFIMTKFNVSLILLLQLTLSTAALDVTKVIPTAFHTRRYICPLSKIPLTNNLIGRVVVIWTMLKKNNNKHVLLFGERQERQF